MTAWLPDDGDWYDEALTREDYERFRELGPGVEAQERDADAGKFDEVLSDAREQHRSALDRLADS